MPQKPWKPRLPLTQLQDQIQTIIRNLSPNVADKFRKLIEAARRLKTNRDRDTHCVILNEWNRHRDESKLSNFMTNKMAEITKRLEQEPEAFRTRIHNMDTVPGYRKLATDYLRSNFSTDDLAQILDTPARLKELGSNLFEKCDADMLRLAKCPEDFKSVEDVRRWRNTRNYSLSIKRLILKVLPSDFRQTLSSHSASESGLDSLARAAELRLAADRNGAESNEPQDGSNRDHHDMSNINIPPRHDPSPSAEGDLLLPLRTLYEAANAAAENSESNAFDNGINGANEVTSRECQKRRRPSGEVAEDAGPDGAEADEVESGAEDGWQHLGWEGELPFTLQVRGRARRCLTA